MIKNDRNYLLTYFSFKTLKRSYLIKVKDETIDDALEAVKLMQQTKGINKNKIFLHF